MKPIINFYSSGRIIMVSTWWLGHFDEKSRGQFSVSNLCGSGERYNLTVPFLKRKNSVETPTSLHHYSKEYNSN